MRNPYVTQMDKFSSSLQYLSHFFLKLGQKNEEINKTQMEDIFLEVHDKVCQNCEKYQSCMNENSACIYQIICEILQAVDEYGVEIPMELKRKLHKKCIHAPFMLQEILEIYSITKKTFFLYDRISQNREGCAIQLESFAKAAQESVRELDQSIFSDEEMKKRIEMQLRKIDVYLSDSLFLKTKEGRYELHLTVRSKKGQCVTTKEVIENVSTAIGRKMVMEKDERPIIGEEYCTITILEGPKFHTLQGVARIGKGCDKISGDNFLMMQLPGGKQGVILSDGMGSGEKAFEESSRAVEMLEELLGAGFSKETAIQMLNTALVMGREEISFSTIDMSVFDLYNGMCEFVKAGASTTYIKRGREVERINSTSLPVGVVQKLDLDIYRRKLKNGEFVIMVTDGVTDAFSVQGQECLLDTIISGTNIQNPKEFAHHILQQVLEWTGKEPEDDMTVLVAGIWSLERHT